MHDLISYINKIDEEEDFRRQLFCYVFFLITSSSVHGRHLHSFFFEILLFANTVQKLRIEQKIVP